MKTRIIISAVASLLLTAITYSHAQETFSIGPRFGVNFANVSNVSNSKSRAGLVFGATSTYSLSETSGISADILYSQEGYKTAGGTEVKLDYLQIPLYFNVFFGKLGQAFRPKVYAGVSPGFLLKADSNGQDISDSSNKVVLNLTGGLGFNYRLADRVWLNVDGRSFLGLSDISKDEFQTNDKRAARNLQLSAGVSFGLSRLN